MLQVPHCWHLYDYDFFDERLGSLSLRRSDYSDIMEEIIILGLTNPRLIMASDCHEHGTEHRLIQTNEVFLWWENFMGDLFVIEKPDNLYDIIQGLYLQPRIYVMKCVSIYDYQIDADERACQAGLITAEEARFLW